MVISIFSSSLAIINNSCLPAPLSVLFDCHNSSTASLDGRATCVGSDFPLSSFNQSTKTMTATQSPSKSGKYLSSQYAATDFSFPYAQVVRGEEDMTHCGYFIPLPQAQKAGWSDLEATETIIYSYNNGEKAEGIYSPNREWYCVQSANWGCLTDLPAKMRIG